MGGRVSAEPVTLAHTTVLAVLSVIVHLAQLADVGCLRGSGLWSLGVHVRSTSIDLNRAQMQRTCERTRE